MGRPQNPGRRDELLEQLVALTSHQSLAQLTFRAIAAELDVSTYTLVYHFGTRRELLDAVLSEAMRRRLDLIGGLDFLDHSRAQMTAALRTACLNTLSQPEISSIRLQFEGAALEHVDPDVGQHVSRAYHIWTGNFSLWIQRQGVSEARSLVLARLMIDVVSGIQFGHILSGQSEESIKIFDVFLDGFMESLFASKSESERVPDPLPEPIQP